MDRTRLDGSIIGGAVVEDADSLARQIVLIVQNYEMPSEGKATFFGLCSGIVINHNVVLTAAHCVHNKKNLRVITATNVHSDNALKDKSHQILEAVIHPAYVKSTIDPENPLKLSSANDLALLWIETMDNVFFERAYLMSQQTKSFLSSKTLPDKLLSVIAGFGRNSLLANPDASIIDVNKKVNGILTKAEIEIKTALTSQPTFWVDEGAQPGACSGDSGGPLFVQRRSDVERKYLQALAIGVSPTKNEATQSASKCQNIALYLNLDFHKKWIRLEIMNLSKKYLFTKAH